MTGGEGWWRRPDGEIRAVSVYETGLDEPGRERFAVLMRELGPSAHPTFPALQRMPGRLVTATRSQVVSDAQWYRSVIHNEYRRAGGLDHCLSSVFQVSAAGAISAINADRAAGERDFSPRERRLLNFFHGELGPLIGRALVSDTELSPQRLSPRLRQTLACLVEGDSEKQVAARLGLSPATTHQYVTMLYRRFGVQSRAQLLAHVLKRMGTGPWGRYTLQSTLPPST